MKLLNRDRLIQKIQARAEADIANKNIGGIAFCVMQDGKEIYRDCFGVKSQATKEPMNDGVMFRLASMTKPIIATAALILVDRGLLDLDAPISRILPEFTQMQIGKLGEDHSIIPCGAAKTPLTPRILLTHSSGLGSGKIYPVEFARATDTDKQDLAHITKFWSTTALAFEPTTNVAYSPVAAFDVLARIVEVISGQSFDQFLQEKIFEPCGMADTTFCPTPAQWQRMIAMYNRTVDPGSGQMIGVDAPMPQGCVFENFPTTWFCGGAGLAGTLGDYVKFAEMLCGGGATEQHRILSEQSVREMGSASLRRIVHHDPSLIELWGLGVRVMVSENACIPKGCFGWSGAYGTHFWVDPTNRITAVYMKNSAFDGGSGAITSAHFEEDVYASLVD